MNCQFILSPDHVGRFYCPICDAAQSRTVPFQSSLRKCGLMYPDVSPKQELDRTLRVAESLQSNPSLRDTAISGTLQASLGCLEGGHRNISLVNTLVTRCSHCSRSVITETGNQLRCSVIQRDLACYAILPTSLCPLSRWFISRPLEIQRPSKVPTLPPNSPLGKRLKNRELLTTPPPRVSTQEGVGTELKAILATLGIKESEGCNCSKRSKIMNAQGIQWCQDNIETIIDWMQEEAKKRKLPFLRVAAKVLVKRAIRNARKKGNAL